MKNECSDSELWRPIEGHEGRYEVSDLGRVRSLDRWVPYKNGHGRRMKSLFIARVLDRDGYQCVCLRNAGNGKTFRVHRLVASAFVKKDNPNQVEVNHIDGDKLNNTSKNLEWVTRSENQQHAYDNDLRDRYNATRAKLEPSQVIEIRRIHAEGTHTLRDLAEMYGVGQTAVGKIVRGERWTHLLPRDATEGGE